MDPIEAACRAICKVEGRDPDNMKAYEHGVRAAIEAYTRETPPKAVLAGAKSLAWSLAGQMHWEKMGPILHDTMKKGFREAVEAYERAKLQGGTNDAEGA
jgi:hypothetical protein